MPAWAARPLPGEDVLMRRPKKLTWAIAENKGEQSKPARSLATTSAPSNPTSPKPRCARQPSAALPWGQAAVCVLWLGFSDIPGTAWEKDSGKPSPGPQSCKREPRGRAVGFVTVYDLTGQRLVCSILSGTLVKSAETALQQDLTASFREYWKIAELNREERK